ncbi:MAG TPA: tRNA (pseudouridine(54)-N(1))-methyltransferase TrmY [Methanotrichaceae archaeon]|nr:tRNA (pseudouridine(54)-N(1))-methyltransferase TrmY [Methanotrichaceae archaeon]
MYHLTFLWAMRIFIVVGHKATTSPDFSLEDIPGTSGRLDILCRCINASFVLSHGIRKDVNVYLVLLGGETPKTLWLKGDVIKHLNPDERTTAALLKKALALEAMAEWTRSTPGIFVRMGGLAELLQDSKEKKLVYLREDGADIRSIDRSSLKGDLAFILGDHMGMTPEEESLIDQAGATVVSVGPTSLHADHCIVLINNEIDRREKEESL